MAVKLPDDLKKLKALCERYQKQVKDLTQKCEREAVACLLRDSGNPFCRELAHKFP